MSFFRQPPPEFLPLRQDVPIEVYTRNMPHWRQKGATYFVTTRTKDSLPQEALNSLRFKREQWLAVNPPPHSSDQIEERGQLLSSLEEEWLDAGHGACPFREVKVRAILMEAFAHKVPEQLSMKAFIVMPNHVHAIAQPLREHKLEVSLGLIKGATSFEVNAILGKQGALWFAESFDRIIRDAEHCWRCLQYLGRNASKAGLGGGEFGRWVCDEWVEAGWTFKGYG